MIVMPAYRLNVFGFLTSEELEAEAKKNGESVGNMGFWDQRMALEWTIKNIGAFGGNANCVTVGGYSAGKWIGVGITKHRSWLIPTRLILNIRTACV